MLTHEHIKETIENMAEKNGAVITGHEGPDSLSDKSAWEEYKLLFQNGATVNIMVHPAGEQARASVDRPHEYSSKKIAFTENGLQKIADEANAPMMTRTVDGINSTGRMGDMIMMEFQKDATEHLGDYTMGLPSHWDIDFNCGIKLSVEESIAALSTAYITVKSGDDILGTLSPELLDTAGRPLSPQQAFSIIKDIADIDTEFDLARYAVQKAKNDCMAQEVDNDGPSLAEQDWWRFRLRNGADVEIDRLSDSALKVTCLNTDGKTPRYTEREIDVSPEDLVSQIETLSEMELANELDNKTEATKIHYKEMTEEEMLRKLSEYPGARIEEWGNEAEMKAIAETLPEFLREDMLENITHGWTINFPNGFSADINDTICGRESGLLELAVMSENKNGQKDIRYDTPVADDVLSGITPFEAYKKALEVAELPAIDAFEAEHSEITDMPAVIRRLKAEYDASVKEYSNSALMESAAVSMPESMRSVVLAEINHGWNIAFKNGYSMNVTDTGESKSEGLLELAVLDGKGNIRTDTPAADRLLDFITPQEVYETAQKVADLPSTQEVQRDKEKKIKEIESKLDVRYKEIDILFDKNRELESKFLKLANEKLLEARPDLPKEDREKMENILEEMQKNKDKAKELNDEARLDIIKLDALIKELQEMYTKEKEYMLKDIR